MKTKTTFYITVTLVVLSFLAASFFWKDLPAVMDSHWDVNDQVNGTMGKFWGTMMLPIVLLAMLGMFYLIPRVDPLKENIAEFRPAFNLFIVLISLFMAYVYGLSIAWNLGARFNMSNMIIPGIGLIFIGSGYLITQAKRNYFIGIRTPWTLANDLVWDKTHAMGGKLFIASGIIVLLSIFFIDYAFPVMMVVIFGTVIVTFLYSYLIYARLGK